MTDKLTIENFPKPTNFNGTKQFAFWSGVYCTDEMAEFFYLNSDELYEYWRQDER